MFEHRASASAPVESPIKMHYRPAIASASARCTETPHPSGRKKSFH